MLKSKMSSVVVVVLLVSIFLVTGISGETLKAAENGLPYIDLQFETECIGDNNYVAKVTFTFPTSGYEVLYKDQVALAGIVNPDGSTSMSFRGTVDEIIKPSGITLQVLTNKTITFTLGKLSAGSHQFILSTKDGMSIVSKEFETISYEKYLPTADKVDVKVSEYSYSEAEGVAYKVLVQLTFPDPSYKAEYDKSLITTKVKNTDGTEYYSHVGTANITKRNGVAPQVITPVTLEYDLKNIDQNSSHQFVFNVDGIKCYEHVFTPVNEILANKGSVTALDTWSGYKPLMGQIEVEIENDSKSNYTAYVNLTFPSSGYRVTSDGEVAVSAGVNPDGSTLKTLQALATVEQYSGPALTVITTEKVKFGLGNLSAGKYQFVFAGKVYKFEVVQAGNDKPKIIFGDLNNDSKVDAIDFAHFRRYFINTYIPYDNEEKFVKYADLDGSGTVNAIDFAYFRKYLLGQIKKFPVES